MYTGVNIEDPIRLYNVPFLGGLYRKRVELCLSELLNGERMLEIGFGSGVTFLNLNEMYKEIHGVDLTSNVELITATFKKLGIQTFLKSGDVFHLPYGDGYFDSVLLISILEHLKPESLALAFKEIYRVLKPNGQVVYGVPVEKKSMQYAFKLLGSDIRTQHFSDEKQVAAAAATLFKKVVIRTMDVWPFGKLYEIGHFVKREAN